MTGRPVSAGKSVADQMDADFTNRSRIAEEIAGLNQWRVVLGRKIELGQNMVNPAEARRLRSVGE